MTVRWLMAGMLIAMFSGGIQTPPAPAPSVVVLTVHVLVTSDGGERGGTGLFADRYPKTITVENVTPFSNRIAAYGAAYRVWIAPKGWAGSAAVGADGSTDVDLHSARDSARSRQRFHYENSGGCAGCAVISAAPYFPSAKRQWKELFSNITLSPIPPGAQITHVSQSVVTYSYPSGHDLLARGVIHFDSANQFFEQAEFVLPRADSKLLNFLLQRFISSAKLR
jgi:Domain of unknown function (DUF4850)